MKVEITPQTISVVVAVADHLGREPEELASELLEQAARQAYQNSLREQRQKSYWARLARLRRTTH